MSLFLKKFLRESRGIFSRETKPRLFLGAFGKHPGWDDHIDDIGLETENLLLAKQILYVDGIGGQINTGEWEKLGDSQRVEGFKHIFLWKRGDAFILGRISSSRDGKNRTKYPMILCAECLGIPFDWALLHLLPMIDKAETQCKSAASADEVRSILRLSQDEMRRSLARVEEDSASQDRPIAINQILSHLDAGGRHEALYRIVYYIDTQMARYLSSAKGDNASELRPGQIRLPAASDLPAETLGFWSHFLESQFGTDMPLLLILPLQECWLDATVGEPATREFYSLRARPDVLTIASEVPYTIASDFRDAHKEMIQAMIEARAGSRSPSDRPGRPKKWFS